MVFFLGCVFFLFCGGWGGGGNAHITTNILHNNFPGICVKVGILR